MTYRKAVASECETGNYFERLEKPTFWPTHPLVATQARRRTQRALDTFVYAHAALHGQISMGLRLNEEVEGMAGRIAMSVQKAKG